MLFLIYGVGILTFFTLTIYHVFLHAGYSEIVYASQSCTHIGKNHVIQIQNNTFHPSNLIVSKCDVVTFTNSDKNALYLPAFGEHPRDITYAGFPQKVLGFNRSESFVVHTPAILPFHDHLRDQAQGKLTIK